MVFLEPLLLSNLCFSFFSLFLFFIMFCTSDSDFKHLVASTVEQPIFSKACRMQRCQCKNTYLNNVQPCFDWFAFFLKFKMKLQFWVRHESKLVVPNKWDNSKLDLCISIGELVKPLHKEIFQNSSLLPPLLFDEIVSIYFLGII